MREERNEISLTDSTSSEQLMAHTIFCGNWERSDSKHYDEPYTYIAIDFIRLAVSNQESLEEG